MQKKLNGIVLLVVAAGLAYFGYDMSQSVASKLSGAFTGGPTDRVLLMYAGAAICAVLGVWRLVK